MFKTYLKIALRNLLRNKGFSITNLVGLTIGITCTIFIFLWVRDELTFDTFNKNYDSIYKVMVNRDWNGKIITDDVMILPLANVLQNGYPQIKKSVLSTQGESYLITYHETKLKKNGYTVSKDFFDIFSCKFIKGNAANAIADPSSIVITQSLAKALFGNEEPINKVVKVDNTHDYKVTAVVANPPGNSTQQFELIKPFNFNDEFVKKNMADWVNCQWTVFIQVAPGTDIKGLNKAITAVVGQHNPRNRFAYFLHPMSKWHLYSDFKDGKNTGGAIEYVRLFTAIAIIILLIACINFMNLSTARSEKRAKEVGIRKTLGSGKKELVFQFYMESILLTLIGFIVSLLIVYILLPQFNTLVGKQLHFNLMEPAFLIGSLVIILFTGLVAGSYPALYLSSFNPVKVLKGTFIVGKKAAIPRKLLVIGQFVVSILLISSTIVVYQQIQHVKDRHMGYNPDNLIMIPSSPLIVENFDVVKNELLKTGLFNSITRTSSPITDIYWKSPAPNWDGKPANLNLVFSALATDVDFAKTMGVKFLMGHDFGGMPSDTSAMILNHAAIKVMGLSNPIGMKMHLFGKIFTVIGVTDDIVMSSPYAPVDPMQIFYNKKQSDNVTVRLKTGASLPNALHQLETVFKTYGTDNVFEYHFVDQEFGKKFVSELLISRLTNIFSSLAIFICCMGLAGLASFTIEKRLKEIAVRKVLGASINQLLMLISKEFLKLVAIAFVIAVPISWWLMTDWLQKYSYHTNISMWLFGTVGVIILLLTLAVVSVSTIGAAARNPVKSLKVE